MPQLPTATIKSIVRDLIDHLALFSDWDNPSYSNIESFKRLESRIETHMMGVAL
jgi:hypothetical protein